MLQKRESERKLAFENIVIWPINMIDRLISASVVNWHASVLSIGQFHVHCPVQSHWPSGSTICLVVDSVNRFDTKTRSADQQFDIADERYIDLAWRSRFNQSISERGLVISSRTTTQTKINRLMYYQGNCMMKKCCDGLELEPAMAPCLHYERCVTTTLYRPPR